MKELSTRTFFGLIFVFLMLGFTYFSETSFHILFIILLLVSIYEIIKMKKNIFSLILLVTLPLLLVHDFNRNLVLLIFIFTCIYDSFAYLIGVRFGKNKLAPSISPKKSWEGFIGGSIFMLSIFYIFDARNFLSINSFEHVYFLFFMLPITATLGDLAISFFKRKANVKDTGRLIPGHGGILDRIDALLFTIPIFYFFLK